ncbi:MAG: peptidyl-prolyl cis-trans isomerase [Lachnospiraceae bacterium]|nr:peptidyl-prolyl cis-trans isomerase [Lachnospiraceae bacterium]
MSIYTIFGLTACGSEEKESSEVSTSSEESSIFDDNSIVMYIDGEKIRYNDISAYTYFLVNHYKSFGDDLWNYSLEDGETIGDKAKDDLINIIAELKIINNEANKQGIVLTDDESNEVIVMSEEVLANTSSEDKNAYSLGAQKLEKIFQENMIARKMYFNVVKDVESDISDDEVRQASIEYIKFIKNGKDKDGNQVSLTEDQIEVKRNEAQKLLNQVKKGQSFISFAKNNSESSDFKGYIGNYSSGFGEDVIKEAMSLKPGEISDVCEDDNAIYILYCIKSNDKKATQAEKERVLDLKKNEIFSQKYEEWIENAEIMLNDDFWNDFKVS